MQYCGYETNVFEFRLFNEYNEYNVLSAESKYRKLPTHRFIYMHLCSVFSHLNLIRTLHSNRSRFPTFTLMGRKSRSVCPSCATHSATCIYGNDAETIVYS